MKRRSITHRRPVRRRGLLWMARLIAASLLLAPGSLLAQEEGEEPMESTGRERKTTSLEEKIRPVSGHLFLKDSRVEISPTLGLSLADAFFQKYSVGAKASYHITETFSIGAHGSYALNFAGSALSVCRTSEEGAVSCARPEVNQLKDVPGKIDLMAGIDVAWAPIYGKISLLAEKVLHFDMQVVAGASGIRYQAPGGKMTFGVGGHIGIGQRFFISESVTLRAELRDYIYRADTVRLGESSSKFENQIMFELGVSFFLGKPNG